MGYSFLTVVGHGIREEEKEEGDKEASNAPEQLFDADPAINIGSFNLRTEDGGGR